MFLFLTDIHSAGNFVHNWFDAQNQCLNHGLTTEKDKSNQPYWTGLYRRLTPWINILGQYFFLLSSDSKHFLFYIIYNFQLMVKFCFLFLVCFTRVISVFLILKKFELRTFCLKDAIPNQPIFCNMWLKRL